MVDHAVKKWPQVRLPSAGLPQEDTLLGMLIAEGWDGSSVVAQGIGTALTLSGLFDLQPLRYTSVNSWLSLNEEDAIRNSPIQHIPGNSNTHLIASVGGREELCRKLGDDGVR